MFVEQLTWKVPAGGRESSLRVLSMLHHHMDASGGLIKSLTGADADNGTSLLSLSFWKSWEDLSRFLAGPKASLLDEMQSGVGARSVTPHYYEVVWEWPATVIDTACGESCWMINDFQTTEERSEELFDALRQAVPRLGQHPGFRCAGLWLDKSSSTHLNVASQWSGDLTPDRLLLDNVIAGGSGQSTSSSSLWRMRVSDPHHLGVA